MRLGLITPTRGRERAAFVEQAARLIRKQTYQPAAWYLVDYPPATKDFDLFERIQHGVISAKRDGITHLAFWEDDDYYRHDYLENAVKFVTDTTDIAGSKLDPMYHLKYKRWGLIQCDVKTINLHRTIGSVDYIQRALDNRGKINLKCAAFIDHILWESINDLNAKVVVKDASLLDCISMKHGTGLCGTAFHGDKRHHLMPYCDPELHWLKQFTGDDFEFYEQQVKRLNKEVVTVL